MLGVWRRLSYVQETEVPSRGSSRDAEACDSIRARWRVPTLPGNFHCRARPMAHLEKGVRSCREALLEGHLVELTEEEVKDADRELARYRWQACVEGAYPDV